MSRDLLVRTVVASVVAVAVLEFVPRVLWLWALIAAAVAALLVPGVVRGRRSWLEARGKGGAAAAALREKVLTRQFLLRAPPAAPDRVRCAVMDWRVGSGAATLVAFDDGSTSLYLIPRGGIIGAGAHENVPQAATAFRQEAASLLDRCSPVETFPLPPPKRVVVYLVTSAATLSSGELETRVVRRATHPYAALERKAQAVITAIRRVSMRANAAA